MITEMDFYKEIVDVLPEGIIICDPEHVIIDVNKNFEQVSGFLKNELKGKNFLEIIKPSTVYKAEEKEVENSTNSTYQLGELKDKNNKLICIRINHSVTKENNIIYLIIPFSNIAFLNQAHIDFVSTVSHELRTPLTSIKGFADTLLSAGSRLNSEQQTKFITIIKSQVDRLTRLVENLLTVSKLEARQSKPIYKEIKVKNIIENVLYNIQHKAREHKIEINIHQNLPHVWADSDKLEQILMNLVDNAVKYSDPGTIVNIDAGFVQNKTDMVEIKVTDHGFGIPEKFLSRVFTKFSRIDSPLTRQVQGTGLGLYITKSLVKSMNGDITIESSDKGSIFTVTLPAAFPETHTKQKFQENN